jgi:RNA polymerase sigma factor (sigma-70 family)
MPASSAPTAEMVRTAQGNQERAASSARLALLRRYRPLLRSLVTSAAPRPSLCEDANQAAVLGFLEALLRYDVQRGATIATFARPFIKGAILDALYETAQHPPLLDVDDLADDDEPGRDDAHLGLADISDAASALRQFIAGLSREQQILLKRVFVDGATQADVARERGVTRAAINQTLAGIYRRGRLALRTYDPGPVDSQSPMTRGGAMKNAHRDGSEASAAR